MPRTERPQSASATPTAPDITYEDVRKSFLIRLHGELTRLTTLSDALGSAAVAPASVFGNLEGFAHRLRGAAAMFDFPELGDASKVLEFAANAAVVAQAPRNEPQVSIAIGSLRARLTCLTEGSSPPEYAVALVPTN